MGKICIVRRRKRGPYEPADVGPSMNGRIASERRCDSVFREIASEGEGSITVRLTRDQTNFIRSHRHFDRLLDRAGEGVQVDIAQGPEKEDEEMGGHGIDARLDQGRRGKNG